MTDDISSLTAAYQPLAATLTNTSARQAQGVSLTMSSTLGDQADISTEARQAWQASQSGQASSSTKKTANTWEGLFNITSGTKHLKNGNKQVTTIQGAELLVLEYEGDKLVRKETGLLGSNSIIKDIEYYDESGDVAQAIHSELVGLEDGGLSSSATLKRSAQWYNNGTLTREYSDSMELEVGYRGLEDLEIKDEDVRDAEALASRAGKVTQENAATRFAASIKDYVDGNLAQVATVTQDTSLELQTNRTGKKISDKEDWTVQALGGESGFSATVTNYDAKGKLLREASFDEEIGIDGEKTQRLSTTWYNNGELVKKSSGVFEGSVQDGMDLNAQLFLDTLDLTPSEYATHTPGTAAELLTKNFQAASDAPEFYISDAEGTNGQGVFGSARNLESYQNVNDPYSLTWTEELYKDGKLAARQQDTEGARKNDDARKYHFALGAGLTEDESPRLLRESSHTDASYDENGRLAVSASIERHEEVEKDERGVYHLWTSSTGTQVSNGETLRVSKREENPLATVDPEAKQASKGFAAAADLTLDDVRDMLNTLEEPGQGTQEAIALGKVEPDES